MITVLILLIALGILGWGFFRARPFGLLGILAWLQSVILMVPWLLFFGLFAVGIVLNLAEMLFLFLLSIGGYIFLGSRLRAMASNPRVLKPSSRSTSLSSTELGNGDDGLQPDTLPTTTATNLKPEVSKEGTKIPPGDLNVIKSIFELDTFFATETIPYQDGAIFRGNLRGEVDASYTRLTANLTERLGDRYRLFLINGQDDKPVVVVLSKANDPKPTTLVQALLAAILALATIATTLETSGLMLGFDLFQNLPRFRETLPIGIGILLILATHEIGHQLLARRYQVRLSPPFFIPTWQIGSFGALTRIESLLPHRSALFDIAVAGPIGSGVVSLGILITGLLLSHPGSLFQVPSELFQGSILVGSLARVVLGDVLQQPLVDLHPLALVGWLGLVLTAINLMPAGQLDGGRVVQAIYGRKTAGRTTVVTLIVLGLAAFVNQLALYWAIVVLVLQRDLERPALNELSEPDDARAALGLLALFLMAATLLPLAPNLAGRLGIGG